MHPETKKHMISQFSKFFLILDISKEEAWNTTKVMERIQRDEDYIKLLRAVYTQYIGRPYEQLAQELFLVLYGTDERIKENEQYYQQDLCMAQQAQIVERKIKMITSFKQKYRNTFSIDVRVTEIVNNTENT